MEKAKWHNGLPKENKIKDILTLSQQLCEQLKIHYQKKQAEICVPGNKKA